MTLKECYTEIGGDYADVMERIPSEKFVYKFLQRFMDDPSYASLCEAMERQDVEEAFRAVHTLKGVCQNLGITQLYESSCVLTELLRTGSLYGTNLAMCHVAEDYEVTVQAIRKLNVG